MISDVIVKNRRILVIDDNEAIHQDFLKILSDQSARQGLNDLKGALFGAESVTPERISFQIESAFQGRDGWEKLCAAAAAGSPYAVAFVDMRMPPGWDGLETIEHILKDDPNVQVVICTAYSDYSWDEITARFGHSDRLLLLKKPFDNAEVYLLACALTEKWHLARQEARQLHELERRVDERTSELRSANTQLRDQIDQRSSAERRLRHEVLHDSLTGLPNRTFLRERLEKLARRSSRNGDNLYAVMYLDIDNFKVVNDSLGHDAGDALLIEVAKRIKKSVRESDSVARVARDFTERLGGDEFVVLLEEVTDPSDAVRVAWRIQAHLSQPFTIQEDEIVTSASIGISIADRDCRSAEDLLRNADIAMYRAKSAGKAQCALFDEAMHVAALARLHFERDLHAALQEEQFILQYQPIVDVASGVVRGFEALCRWNHPSRGIILPGDFIAVAEEKGLIVPLGWWVLREACSRLQEWNVDRDGLGELTVSVNISKRQLIEPEFLEGLRSLLRQTGCPTRLLILEITESICTGTTGSIDDTLRQLREMEIELHMDDFGTGLSSIARLRDSPFRALKIDQSFVRNIHEDERHEAVTRTIITLAHSLDMKTVAECVESAGQLASLRALGCDYAQGFLFSAGMDATEVIGFLENLPDASSREPVVLDCVAR